VLLGNEPGISDYRCPSKLGGSLPGVSPEPTKCSVVDKSSLGKYHPLHAYCEHTILMLGYGR